jgi:hypothetical protein
MRRLVVIGLAFTSIVMGSCSSKGGDTDTTPAYHDMWVYPDQPRFDAKPDQPASCGEQAFTIERTTPDMVIALDRSASMGIGASPIWDSCRNAIYDVTAAMDKQVWFGLFVFPNSLGSAACDDKTLTNICTAPSDALVPAAAGTSGTIKTALTTMTVCGGTPTAATLTSAKQYLQTLASNKHPKYIILATDGGPNCNSTLDGSKCTCVATGACSGNNGNLNCLDDVATFKVLDDLVTAGIKTYVVGLGADPSIKDVLPGLATHGGTGSPYSPADAAAIKKAFTDITNAVASCEFSMDCSKIPDPGLVNFYFDGKVVSFDNTKQTGWAWTTACVKGQAGTGGISFFGADCTSLKSGAVKDITAKFGCPTHLQ